MTETKNKTKKNDKTKFSRDVQPVKCRVCGKRTTWASVHGEGGGDICQKCWDAVGIENEHLDGHHKTTPVADCPMCQSENKIETTENGTNMKTTKTAKIVKTPKGIKKTLAVDLEAGKILAKDSLGEIVPEIVKANVDAAATKQLDVVVAKLPAAKKLSKRDAKSLAKKAAIDAAAKKPLPDEKPAKKEKSADNALRIHLYGTGKVFLFSKLAAERIDGMPNMQVKISGRKMTLTPTKSAKDTTPITAHQGRPILRASRILKDVEWSGKTQDLIAKPVGDRAFEVVLS